MDPIEPVHRVVISRGIAHRTGDLFMDAPEHSSIPELIAIATDRSQWREYVNQLAGLGEHGSVKAVVFCSGGSSVVDCWEVDNAFITLQGGQPAATASTTLAK